MGRNRGQEAILEANRMSRGMNVVTSGGMIENRLMDTEEEGEGGMKGESTDTTERLHFHFSLSCIGEGNGNPLQCSCPENPRDGGAWWAAVYGVAQSQTRLKRLSSSSSIYIYTMFRFTTF